MEVKELTLKEVLNLLPGSWEELKLKDFHKVMDIEVDEAPEDNEDILKVRPFIATDHTIQVIHKITGVDLESLESLPLFAIHKLGSKLEFMMQQPVPKKKSPIPLKTMEELSYDDFVTFNVMSKDPIKNLPILIKTFSLDRITEEQVLDMNMVDAQTVFFFVNKRLKTYLKRSIQSLRNQIWIQEVLERKSNRKGGSKKMQPLPEPLSNSMAGIS